EIRQGVERGILVIRYASAFPPHMGLVGHMVFQHLDQAALADPGFPTQQNDLPMPCLGLLPPFQEQRDFRLPTDQRSESSWLSNIKATGGPTLTEHVVESHGLGDA